MADIQLYDATLRDGMGGGGMSLTAGEKLRVVHALDALGVHMIEAGFPSSNPKEEQLFELLAQERFETAEIVAFGMTRRREIAAEEDEGLRILAESFAPVCTLVGKSSLLHVEKVVRVSREENLKMIGESVAFLIRHGKRVLLDAEHFFDGFAEDPGYALDCARAAADAGAERIVLCDTNGGSLPPQIRVAMAVVSEALPGVPLGIHTHDDSGCAVANTLTAVEGGATQVQGTINGIGERVGNANLVTIIADLQLKLGYELLAPEQLARLTETAHLVDELLNRTPNPAQPYVGKHAFAHKAGLHAAGVRADAQTFEHIDPLLVGNDRDVLVSELSGRGTISEKAREAGISVDEDFAQRVVDRVKSLEHEGFQFEAADGSFELLMRREAGEYEPLFRLESWRVTGRAAGRRERGHRGHDQDLDRRGALCAHGRRERSGERARPGACATRSGRFIHICATSTSSTSRCGSSTRPRGPGPLRGSCSMPPMGSRFGGRSGFPRTLLPLPGTLWSTRSSTACSRRHAFRERGGDDSAGAARAGGGRGARGARSAALGAAVAWTAGACLRAGFCRTGGSRVGECCVQRDRWAASRASRGGSGRRRRGRYQPVFVRRLSQCRDLRAGEARVR